MTQTATAIRERPRSVGPRGPDRRADPGVRARAARRASTSTGAASACSSPTAPAAVPLPLLLSAVHERAARPRHAAHRARRARHPRRDERARARRAPRLRARRARRALSRRRPCSTTRGGTRRRSPTSARSARERIAELSDGMLRPHRARPHQPRRRRARRHADRRPGLPARGRRLLRRQQVPVPRRLRPRADRPLALARRADHQRADHRHARDHPGARADRRGRLDGPRRAARVLRRHAVAHAATCTRSRSATRARPGRRRPTCRPRRTSATSTRRCGACCRWSRPSTTTCGPAPRASTRSSRSSPTAARSCSTRRTSARSARRTRRSREIGYHCRDYFVKQWDRFKDYHWGDLAHSTHLRGAGTYDAVRRRARPRDGHARHRHPRGR